MGTGFLAAGAETDAQLPYLAGGEGKAEFVWFCTDVDNNVHIWAYDGRYERIAAKDYLRGNAPRKASD